MSETGCVPTSLSQASTSLETDTFDAFDCANKSAYTCQMDENCTWIQGIDYTMCAGAIEISRL